MAVEPANNQAASQDMQAHLRDYAGFTHLFTYGAVACFVIGIIVLFIIA
jgi:hypothetical protein